MDGTMLGFAGLTLCWHLTFDQACNSLLFVSYLHTQLSAGVLAIKSRVECGIALGVHCYGAAVCAPVGRAAVFVLLGLFANCSWRKLHLHSLNKSVASLAAFGWCLVVRASKHPAGVVMFFSSLAAGVCWQLVQSGVCVGNNMCLVWRLEARSSKTNRSYRTSPKWQKTTPWTETQFMLQTI